MDKSVTTNTKTMSTTPFSINDILTKNNTTLFRRRISSGDLSPISQTHENDIDTDDMQNDDFSSKLTKMKFFKHPAADHYNPMASMDHPQLHHYHQSFVDLHNSKTARLSASPSMETQSEPGSPNDQKTIFKKINNFHQQSMQYLHNNNNNSTSGKDARAKCESANSRRRNSLDCFLVDDNRQSYHRGRESVPIGDANGKQQAEHHEKMDYYNYPVMVETPLDMRRCADDSGELIAFASGVAVTTVLTVKKKRKKIMFLKRHSFRFMQAKGHR